MSVAFLEEGTFQGGGGGGGGVDGVGVKFSKGGLLIKGGGLTDLNFF